MKSKLILMTIVGCMSFSSAYAKCTKCMTASPEQLSKMEAPMLSSCTEALLKHANDPDRTKVYDHTKIVQDAASETIVYEPGSRPDRYTGFQPIKERIDNVRMFRMYMSLRAPNAFGQLTTRDAVCVYDPSAETIEVGGEF